MKTQIHTTFNIDLYKVFTITFVFILFFILIIPIKAQKRENTAENRFSKEYTIKDVNEIISIANKFGSVEIDTWEQNKVEVAIKIKAWGKNQKQADELLSMIKIDEERERNEISFRTRITSKNVSTNSKSGFKIDYEVKMPKSNPLVLINKYGSSSVGDLENDVEIDAAYGIFRAGKLTGKNIEIDVSFSSSIDIEEIGDASLDLDYPGNVEIDKAGRLEVVAKHGKMRIGEAVAIEGNVKYLSIIVDKLEEEMNIRNEFASNEIGLLGPNFRLVNIDASHGSFSMGVDENTPPFNFMIKTRFGSFKDYSDDVEIIKQKSDYTSAEYEGKYKGGGSAKVYADLTNGSVRFR